MDADPQFATRVALLSLVQAVEYELNVTRELRGTQSALQNVRDVLTMSRRTVARADRLSRERTRRGRRIAQAA
jgi:hypothetical protein